MRIYNDPAEMIKEVERDLYEMGIMYTSETVQDKKVKGNEAQTLELFGYGYILTSWDENRLIDLLRYYDNNILWAQKEAEERLDNGRYIAEPLNPGKAWSFNQEFWRPFLRDGLFSYSYTERWQEQIPYIIHELSLRPNSRQAIMTMYDRHQDIMNWGGRDRVPCSMYYSFLIRQKKLHLTYHQRSCDLIKFFATDVYLTIKLLEVVAYKLNLKIGRFTHVIDSLHAFKNDLEERGIF